MPATFADWLRPKRRVYQAVVLACALVTLLIPLAMHWVQLGLGDFGGWGSVDAFARLHARSGMPWWLLAWLFPLAYTVAVAVALACLEGVLYLLRVDRGDRAWSSMCWALRGWRVALLWTLVSMPVVVVAGSALEWLGPEAEAGLAVVGVVIALALQLLFWNAEYLAAPKPLVRVRPRWPGWLPFLLALAYYAFFYASQAQPSSHQAPMPLFPLIAVAFLLLLGFVFLALEILWLNGSRREAGASVASASRDAVRPRVFLPMLVLQLRWIVCLPLLLLPLLPLVLFLIYVVPGLEEQLACCASDRLLAIVSVSRFAVAWWWAFAIVFLGASFFLPMTWFGPAGSARLLLELGAVRGEAPRED